MLGLTGTVTGLTRAFRTVAALKQVTDPSLLASGIWEALITTIAGLFIGIPALIAYHLYENRLRALAFELKTSGEELVAVLTEHDRVRLRPDLTDAAPDQTSRR
jgi:biopolymer transport protein ExbB